VTVALLAGAAAILPAVTAKAALACETPNQVRTYHVKACDGNYGFAYYPSNGHVVGPTYVCNWTAYSINLATGAQYRDTAHDKTNANCGPSTLREKIVYYAQRERNDANRNHGIGFVNGAPCNWYSGHWGSGASGCSTSGFRAVNWCADFAWYVWQQSGANLAGRSSFADSFRSNGTFQTSTSYTPKAGDVVLFDWDPPWSTTKDPDGTPDIDHVGIVVNVSGNNIDTIEGNTGGGAGATQSHTHVWRTEGSVHRESSLIGFVAPH
jgi:hypothetical protein